ncbi:hypothetical protein [Amycolatopsis sp. ATCC 39116]|uniref:hypothetical protein n=1 Tax=Amycolatopsis sp. (strain ATCC 39116 / 75iv2) TaxID=385957 RepID=UPI0007C4B4FC|nr:hypothetical protein [Amycolatopsis sp. ATCC 39116]
MQEPSPVPTRPAADTTPPELAELATWSSWLPFDQALTQAPRQPGVYLARSAGVIVYVGMAGERKGLGIRGRLAIYTSGKGAVSGLGEAAFNRALADPSWVRSQLTALEAGQARAAKEWARAALDHAALDLAWATTPDRTAALRLEAQVIALLHPHGTLWNARI